MWFYVQTRFPLLTIALTAAILPQRGVIHHRTGKASAVNRVARGAGPWSPFRGPRSASRFVTGRRAV